MAVAPQSVGMYQTPASSLKIGECRKLGSMVEKAGMRDTSQGSISPASRYFDTICEQGCATSALKPEASF